MRMDSGGLAVMQGFFFYFRSRRKRGVIDAKYRYTDDGYNSE
uniref:Uncharacterized protein n=1 Tax=virus sp. ctah610 TaxID=2826807 RepID=A0A8S5R7F6_9VIRU|nr:MAG TPA: hypothetical protein [virus sp. ctah610]